MVHHRQPTHSGQFRKPVQPQHHMKHDIHSLKELLRIPAVWAILGLQGDPAPSCRSPFRPDRTPSFSIFDDGRQWKDFSTGEAGDVINFLARALDIDSRQATLRFIEMAGGASIPTGFRDRTAVSDRHERDERTAKEKAAKRAKWSKSSSNDPEARQTTAQSRNVSTEALKSGEEIGTIRYSELFEFKCWILTDESGLSAEARRIDRLDFPAIGTLPIRKVHTFKGSLKDWPVGTAALKKLPSITRVMLVEGTPDYLAALHFLSAHIDSHGGEVNTLPIAMLGRGAGSVIHPDALAILAGKHVRIYPHNDADGGGKKRAGIWAAQLQAAGCHVEAFHFDGLIRADGQPVNDLNDLCYLKKSQLSEITDLLP